MTLTTKKKHDIKFQNHNGQWEPLLFIIIYMSYLIYHRGITEFTIFNN